MGEDSCTTCSAGRFSSSSSARSECKDCSAGQYQNEEGKGSCKNCGSWRYQDEDGQTTCKNGLVEDDSCDPHHDEYDDCVDNERCTKKLLCEPGTECNTPCLISSMIGG